MGCPHYKGNSECDLQDPGRSLSNSHVLNYCCALGSVYSKCEILKSSPGGLETVASLDPNPMATFEGHDDPIVQMHHRAMERKMAANPHVNKDDLSAQSKIEIDSNRDIDWLLLEGLG